VIDDRGERPKGGEYPSNPPLLVIEIVSKEDRHKDILAKLAEYHSWGVKHVCSVDPWTRKLFVYDDRGYREVATFKLPEFSAELSPAEIFEDQTPQQ
jgi:Uma2 family endonuclease